MVDVRVTGDSPSALAAALELAEVGLKVGVSLGARSAWPVRPVRDPSGSLTVFLTRVANPIREGGPRNDAVLPVIGSPRPVLMRSKRGDWAPVPEPSLLGVPAVPASEQTLAFLSGGSAVRAYLDRVKPVLTIGKTAEFGPLVRNRMGAKLLNALVEPLVRERFGIGADEVDVAIAAPGLNEALTRTGSLSGAVLSQEERTAERETVVRPAGGWPAARDALIDRLALYDVSFEEDSEPGQAPRAVVVDAECDEAHPWPDSPDASGKAHKVRACVSVAIQDPGLPDPGHDAVQVVGLPGGEQWSVRIEFAENEWIARLTGPRKAAVVDPVSRAAAALGVAALTPMSAELRVEFEAAPFATIAERDAAQAALFRVREADPERLVVGRALHGGGTSEAVADALAEAVVLRRHLTGIAE